jgi:hypothetical protein
VPLYRHNLEWADGTDPVAIELSMIRRAPQGPAGAEQRYKHHLAVQRILWPKDDEHRWSELALRELTANTITALMGPGDCGKTYPTAKWGLVEYWASPDDTLVIVSSTDLMGLELRVWGKMKELFNRALDRCSWLPGHAIDSLHVITTDEIDDDGERARTLLKGIVCRPCIQNGKFVGIGRYVGTKQRRIRQIADECQLMATSFLDAVPNFLGKDYQGAFLGNPIDPLDPLGRVAEPTVGWLNHPEPTQTEVWDTRFHGGRCVNFVGTDSPNFDHPRDKPPRWPWLISWLKIMSVEAFWGRDSLEYYSQCVGVMKSGLLLNRVINRDLCREHHALDKAHWRGTPRRRAFAVDAAYGGTGGDRCVAGWVEWGEDVDGKVVLRVEPPRIVPVSVKSARQPEDQIAEWVLAAAAAEGIATADIFYDSTGRGTLGAAFARLSATAPPVPVEFGGSATARPVRHDLYVPVDARNPSRGKRHKRCDEHYANFVTELWFSVRYVIECDQLRELPEDVMSEGCLRQFGKAAGNRYKVESKSSRDGATGKPGMKERTGFSPDLFDWLVTAVEGARQRGFRIERLGPQDSAVRDDPSKHLREWERRTRALLASKELQPV